MSKFLVSRTIVTNRRPVAIIFGILTLLARANAMAIEEPEYEVVKTYPKFELHRYEPFLVAETEVTGDFDEVGNPAFRILAAYFGCGRKGWPHAGVATRLRPLKLERRRERCAKARIDS